MFCTDEKEQFCSLYSHNKGLLQEKIWEITRKFNLRIRGNVNNKRKGDNEIVWEGCKIFIKGLQDIRPMISKKGN